MIRKPAAASRARPPRPVPLPPQPSPFDAGFIARACCRYDAPPIARELPAAELAWYGLEFRGPPVRGLGFELADLAWVPVEGNDNWVRQFTRPPRVDIGLRFADATWHRLKSFGSLVDLYKPGGPGKLLPDRRVEMQTHMMPPAGLAWLLPMLPTFWPPAAEEPWVDADHLDALLDWLRSGEIDPRALVSAAALKAWLEETRPAPRPYRVPRSSGEVTYDDIERFFRRRFWTLGKAMCARLGWRDDDRTESVPADEANALARRFLGIGLDLRAGFLIDEDDIVISLGFGPNTRLVGGESIERRLHQQLWRNLSQVKAPEPSGDHNNMEGAAWSCEVARLVSAPGAWEIVPPPAAAECPLLVETAR